MAFLSSHGMSPVEILDYDDGFTFDQLLAFNIEIGRLSLEREKRLVNDLALFASSLFKSEILNEFNTAIDDALENTDIERLLGGNVSVTERINKTEDVQKTMRELGKLDQLFGKAKLR